MGNASHNYWYISSLLVFSLCKRFECGKFEAVYNMTIWVQSGIVNLWSLPCVEMSTTESWNSSRFDLVYGAIKSLVGLCIIRLEAAYVDVMINMYLLSKIHVYLSPFQSIDDWCSCFYRFLSSANPFVSRLNPHWWRDYIVQLPDLYFVFFAQFHHVPLSTGSLLIYVCRDFIRHTRWNFIPSWILLYTDCILCVQRL